MFQGTATAPTLVKCKVLVLIVPNSTTPNPIEVPEEKSNGGCAIALKRNVCIPCLSVCICNEGEPRR